MLSMHSVNQHGQATQRHSSGTDTAINFAFAAHCNVEEKFQKTFHEMNQIKRRNPEQYIRNPNKTYCLTHGKTDYALYDSAKTTKIVEHDNVDSPKRNFYPHVVEGAPKMSAHDYYAE